MKIETLIERMENDGFSADLDYQNERIEWNVNYVSFEQLSKFNALMRAVEERLHRG